MPPTRIIDAVFEERHRPHPIGVALGIAGAIGFHVLLWIWALARGPTLEGWSRDLAAHIHEELGRQDVIEIAKPAPPPPAPPPSSPPPRVEPPKVPRTAMARARPPPPARDGGDEGGGA